MHSACVRSELCFQATSCILSHSLCDLLKSSVGVALTSPLSPLFSAYAPLWLTDIMRPSLPMICLILNLIAIAHHASAFEEDIFGGKSALLERSYVPNELHMGPIQRRHTLAEQEGLDAILKRRARMAGHGKCTIKISRGQSTSNGLFCFQGSFQCSFDPAQCRNKHAGADCQCEWDKNQVHGKGQPSSSPQQQGSKYQQENGRYKVQSGHGAKS